MKKRAFTLLELQVSLLLTVIVLALLALYTGYFFANFYRLQERAAFQSEVDTCFTFLDTTMRNCRDLSKAEKSWTITTFTGETIVLEMDEDLGLRYGAVAFFSGADQTTLNMNAGEHHFEVYCTVSKGDFEASYKRTFNKPAFSAIAERVDGY